MSSDSAPEIREFMSDLSIRETGDLVSRIGTIRKTSRNRVLHPRMRERPCGAAHARVATDVCAAEMNGKPAQRRAGVVRDDAGAVGPLQVSAGEPDALLQRWPIARERVDVDKRLQIKPRVGFDLPNRRRRIDPVARLLPHEAEDEFPWPVKQLRTFFSEAREELDFEIVPVLPHRLAVRLRQGGQGLAVTRCGEAAWGALGRGAGWLDGNVELGHRQIALHASLHGL